MKIELRTIKFLNIRLLIISLWAINFSSSAIFAQNNLSTVKVLKVIADSILIGPIFQFVDEEGNLFNSTDNAAPQSILHLTSSYNDWRYWNGVLNMAMSRLGELLNENSYKEFTIKNIDFCFENYTYFADRYKGENKWNYPFGQFFSMKELDDYGAMGASLIEVYNISPKSSYKEYIKKAAYYIQNQQYRLKDGSFVRSFPHKWTLWADDLFMSTAFLSRMGELTKDNKYFDDATKQVINFHKYLFDKENELMYHNWYSDVNRTGVAFWGRANGWAVMAQVELLDHLPEDYPLRDTLIALFHRHILGIAKYQSGSGLWHQLLDKTDSYLETSCSAMFTYAIARAVNRGFLEKRYSSIAIKGWEGVLLKIQRSGNIEGVCTGTVVSDNLSDYYNRPTPLNDIHGIGVVLLSGTEILQLNKHK